MTHPLPEPGYLVYDRAERRRPLGVPYDQRGVPCETMSRWRASSLAARLARAGFDHMDVVHWTPDGERVVEVHLLMARSDDELRAFKDCCYRIIDKPQP